MRSASHTKQIRFGALICRSDLFAPYASADGPGVRVPYTGTYGASYENDEPRLISVHPQIIHENRDLLLPVRLTVMTADLTVHHG